MSLFSCPTIEAQTDRITLSDPCFISDLHLNTESKIQSDFFVKFLNEVAQQHSELIILGDFFDYWVGDDAWDSAASVLEPLKKWAEHKKLYIMHGNRDFMMGRHLMERLGATLLKDPTVAVIGSRHVLLSHGDLWCTDDQDYQKVRRKVRSFWWQWMVLRLSLKKRLQIAHDARARSKVSKVKKDASKMDVNGEAVIRDAHGRLCDLVIHGHTHRPGCYDLEDGLYRYVLPDWKLEAANTLSGGYLIFKNDKPLQDTFG